VRRVIAQRPDAPDGVVLALACVAQFMVVLDVSIVTVATGRSPSPPRCAWLAWHVACSSLPRRESGGMRNGALRGHRSTAPAKGRRCEPGHFSD